jgi:hypothetical protein
MAGEPETAAPGAFAICEGRAASFCLSPSVDACELSWDMENSLARSNLEKRVKDASKTGLDVAPAETLRIRFVGVCTWPCAGAAMLAGKRDSTGVYGGVSGAVGRGANVEARFVLACLLRFGVCRGVVVFTS